MKIQLYFVWEINNLYISENYNFDTFLEFDSFVSPHLKKKTTNEIQYKNLQEKCKPILALYGNIGFYSALQLNI